MSELKSIYSILNDQYIPSRQEGKAFVYFLIKDDEIVYVGQTVDFGQRLIQHSNKDFDRYNLIMVDEDDVDIIESAYIHFINPKINADMSYHSSKFKTREKRAKYSICSLMEILINKVGK